eukprot:TRINITY_DN3279_c0_g1_i1.p1 TRINITY_DN3279_c0_g1~~TRINITY_DN3279_c0_g1_i1.p1  ORF type:complete len:289 (+),score=65.90 TRINITY_DN3279_c0_g1_i1:60-926(+)
MTEKKSIWIPLESNPAVLNEFLYNLGVNKTWSFCDCFGLTPDVLNFVPTPCLALLLLFPTSKLKDDKKKQEEIISEKGQHLSEKVYFMKQKVGMACGSIAVIHAVANNRDLIELDEKHGLGKFLAETKDKTAEERGVMLGLDENITSIHKTVSNKGQTSAKDFVKTDFHFICFTEIDGHLYELDGTKQFPINHGATTKEKMLQDSAKVIQQNFVNKNPGEMFFSLIALAPAQQVDTPEPIDPVVVGPVVKEAHVKQLEEMGFTREQAVNALTLTNGRIDDAISLCLQN